MTLHAYPELLENLKSKGYRDGYVSTSVRHGIALQIRALRRRESWSQKQLGGQAGKTQTVISRLEDPDYGKVTVQTLLDLAAAFDVALIVRFATFGEMAHQTADLSTDVMIVPPFEVEIELGTERERAGAAKLSADTTAMRPTCTARSALESVRTEPQPISGPLGSYVFGQYQGKQQLRERAVT